MRSPTVTDPVARMADDIIDLATSFGADIPVQTQHLEQRGWSYNSIRRYGNAAVTMAKTRIAPSTRRLQ